jgi:hypothetical protein
MPNLVELLGYAGMAFTILAYAMKNTVKLRLAGIASSVAFLTYGWLSASYPVMMMEAILLPLNLYRLVEIMWFGTEVSTSSQSEFYGLRPDEFVGRGAGKDDWAETTKSEVDPQGFSLADLERIGRLDPHLASRLTQFLLSNPLIKIESNTRLQNAMRAV